MNCYRCLIEMESNYQLACALCQHCGAGICTRHLVELTMTSVAGMAGSGQSRQRLICQRCYQLAFSRPQRSHLQSRSSASKGGEQKKSPLLKIWQRIRGQQQIELLNPEEVLAAAELHLKRERNL